MDMYWHRHLAAIAERTVQGVDAVTDELVSRVAHLPELSEIRLPPGRGVAGQVGRPLEEVTEEDWRVILDVNLSGAFNVSQAASIRGESPQSQTTRSRTPPGFLVTRIPRLPFAGTTAQPSAFRERRSRNRWTN